MNKRRTSTVPPEAPEPPPGDKHPVTIATGLLDAFAALNVSFQGERRQEKLEGAERRRGERRRG